MAAGLQEQNSWNISIIYILNFVQELKYFNLYLNKTLNLIPISYLFKRCVGNYKRCHRINKSVTIEIDAVDGK